MATAAPETAKPPAGLNGWTPSAYPPARRSDRVDVYTSEKRGEVRVADPYDWLEDANGAETNAWTDAQEAYTRAWLDRNADRPKLEAAIRANTDYARFSSPSLKHDGRWYWYYNSGLQPQSVIYRSKDGTLPDFSSAKEEGPGGEVFFDLNLLADDGTAALATTAFARSGEYFAYGISRSGSDFCTVYVRRTDAPLAKGSHDDARLPDEIRFVKFSSITWTHDSKGFFYQRFPDRASHGDAASDLAGTEIDDDRNAMLYYHRVGTSQAEDILVMKDPEHPEWMWGTGISEVDGRYLELYASRDTARVREASPSQQTND
jgi:prolyl oligopeptidase